MEQAAADHQAQLGEAIEDDGDERASSSEISTRHQKDAEQRADVDRQATDVFEEPRIVEQRHARQHQPGQTRGRKGTEARDHTPVRQASVIDDLLRGIDRGHHVEVRNSRFPPLEDQHDSKRRQEQRDRRAIPQIQESTEQSLHGRSHEAGSGSGRTPGGSFIASLNRNRVQGSTISTPCCGRVCYVIASGLMACYVPVRRAARTHAREAPRYE